MRIVKFYKNGCVPCNSVQTLLDAKGVSAESVNIYDDPDTAYEHGIMSVPVTILFDNDNEEVNRVIGFNQEALSNLIKAYEQG